MVLVQVHPVPTGFGSRSQTFYFRKQFLSLSLNSWADAETCLNPCSVRSLLQYNQLLFSCCSYLHCLHWQVRSNVLLLCPWAKTLKDSTCSPDVSHSVSPHLILCNRLKSHSFRKYRTSQVLLSESHPLSHVFFPLHLIQTDTVLWERLLWLWPFLLLFLVCISLKLIH